MCEQITNKKASLLQADKSYFAVRIVQKLQYRPNFCVLKKIEKYM